MVRRNQSAGRNQSAFAIQGIAIAAVLLAAHLAPGKTSSKVLAKPVTLSSSAMTLSEIATAAAERDGFPIGVRLSVPTPDQERVIRFPARQLTLGEFVRAVESQSSLRHRFSGCGNCSSILRGSDCSSMSLTPR